MSDRRVRHLHLAARADAEVRRMLPRLEDALRCASLPERGEQLFLVRRLALGRLPRDASSQTLALLLERRVAAAGGVWVEGGSPAAAAADCVRFASRLDARVALALRLARGQPRAEWYWRPAVPEYHPESSAADNLRRIALAIAGLPEAPAALPAWVACLVEAGAGDALQTAIPAGLGEALADRLGLPPSRRNAAPFPATPARPAAHPGPTAWPARFLAVARPVPAMPALPPNPPARVTTRTMGAATVTHLGTPEHATPPPLARHPATSSRPAGHPRTAPPPLSGPTTRRPAPMAPPRHACHPPALHDDPPPARYEIRPASSGQPLPASSPSVPGADPIPDPRAWLAPTAAGGLLFLLPLLARLGLADCCDRPGRADLPDRVLALAARRLRLDPADPVLAALRVTPGNPRRRPPPAPAAWADPLLATPRGRPAGDLAARLAAARRLDAQAAVFLTAARRWLRRAARLGLADLIRRPARVMVTTTHVDVHFHLADCDIRVRRAGLDLDPGWLPWFGRVVAFHYEAGET